MLRELIDSYLKLDVPNNVNISLDIVENDTSQTVAPIVDAIEKCELHPINYHLETKLGIPCARNRCLTIAMKKKATHIAFVDDDETFSQDWLTTIWAYYCTHNPSTAIQGRVIPIFPDNTKAYIREFFQPKPKKTGDELVMCATNNVIVPIQPLIDHSITFDESAPFSMGEDSKFFRLAKAKGIQLVYCSEAIIYENIPSNRAKLMWLSRRHFLIGINLSVHKGPQTAAQLANSTITSVPKMLIRLTKVLLQLAFSQREKAIKNWLKICKSTGQLLGQFGLKESSYKKTDGY